MPAAANILTFVLLALTFLYFSFIILTETVVSRAGLEPEIVTDPRKLIQRQDAFHNKKRRAQEDYLLSASVALHYDRRISAVDWRHFKSAVTYFKDKLYYVGQIGKLIREKHPHSSPHWNKISKLFFAKLGRNQTTQKFEFYSIQTKFDPFDNLKRSMPKTEKITDPPEFRGNGDCELQYDGLDGGHGYQNPRLIVIKDELYLIFSSRQQVFNNTFCQPGNARFLYICKVILRKFEWPPNSAEIASCEDPIKLSARESGGSRMKSKNTWAPFIYEDKLYLSVAFHPEHLVIDCTGVLTKRVEYCLEVFRTKPSSSISQYFASVLYEDIHLSGTTTFALFKTGKTSSYVGAVHTAQTNEKGKRLCCNYLFWIDADPPFAVNFAKEINLVNRTSDAFIELSNNGPVFYKKFYPSSYECCAVSDVGVLRNDFLENVITQEKTLRPRLVLTYGVSEAETRVRELDLWSSKTIE